MGCILVLDDELDACRLMERVLSALGHEVHAFSDYREATEWVRSRKPDLALIDIKLRGTDGISFLKFFRQKYPFAKVIMITGYPSADTTTKALKFGVEDYLVKPVEIAELEERVGKALRTSLDHELPLKS